MIDKDVKKPLGLRSGVRVGSVTQSFSHGRTKNVVVITKRKRVLKLKPGAVPAPEITPPKPLDKPLDSAPPPSPRPLDTETKRRLEAVQQAKARELEEEAQRAAEEASREKERERRRQEQKAKEREQRAAEEEALRQKAIQDIQNQRAQKEAAQPVADAPRAPKPAPTRRQEREQRQPRGRGREDGGRRTGKLTLTQAIAGDGRHQKSLAAMRRKQERARQKTMGQPSERHKITRDVQLPEAIMVSELANRMAERVADVIKELMKMGMMVTQNQTIDADTAELIVSEFGHRVVRVADSDVEDVIKEIPDREEDLRPRPPVITVMGHVDHGKTSLLDALRRTNVAASEAGGITQRIGACQMTSSSGARLCFLDTPGHAAFTAMRARGAQVTDIVVLVVAADDSVMPQTIEAINHAKAAGVPIIVAINKIDKPEANPDRVRSELLHHGVVVESMSGDVQEVLVSAATGAGLDALLEAIALQAEILELKAAPNRAAQGAVIESQLDVGRGPVATVLVQKGTLRQGDIFVVGEQYGKVRALIDDQGKRLTEAAPSTPVEVLGLNGIPEAGDVLNVTETEAQAREISAYRQQLTRDKRATAGSATTLEQLMQKAKNSETVAELPVLIKADTQGSSGAILQATEKIGTDEVRVRVLHAGVGAITETDVSLAVASDALIVGFNVRANAPARVAAQQKGVDMRYYAVIYDLVDDVKKMASGLLRAEIREDTIGQAEIKEVFKVSGVGRVAGCLVSEGVARRAAKVRLLRDNVVIHEGQLKTLKRFKDEVSEVQSGQECGMAFDNYDDLRAGDTIEVFESREVARSLA
ncbi:MAG: translation initiation factor IF-2 [Rhodobacteraceae bacterium]|nr:translation initiation factor IF-2 [Paracoccaceae bacterium]